MIRDTQTKSLEDEIGTLLDGGEAEPVEAAEPVDAAPLDDAPEVEEEASDEPEPPRSRDEVGRFAKGKASARPVVPAKAAPATAPVAAAAKPTDAPTHETPEPKPEAAAALKPPSSWKPGAREKWAALPPEVQQEAVRIDREVRKVLQERADFQKQAGEARAFREKFDATFRPFEGFMAASGHEPMESLRSLAQTAAALQAGAPAQKAALVAQIIQGYGVPVELVASHLDGQAPPQQAHAPQPQQPLRDPRVDQLMERITQAEQRRAQAFESQVATAVEEFGETAEFFEDVKESMADFVAVWERNGVIKPGADMKPHLQRAYDLAVAQSPEIAGILKQREAEKAAKATRATTQRARTAASSVRTSPTVSAPAKPRNDFEAVAQMYEELENR